MLAPDPRAFQPRIDNILFIDSIFPFALRLDDDININRILCLSRMFTSHVFIFAFAWGAVDVDDDIEKFVTFLLQYL